MDDTGTTLYICTLEAVCSSDRYTGKREETHKTDKHRELGITRERMTLKIWKWCQSVGINVTKIITMCLQTPNGFEEGIQSKYGGDGTLE